MKLGGIREIVARICPDSATLDPGYACWISQPRHQSMIGHSIGLVEIPPEHNQTGIQAAATVKNGRNPKAARAWLGFLRS